MGTEMIFRESEVLDTMEIKAKFAASSNRIFLRKLNKYITTGDMLRRLRRVTFVLSMNNCTGRIFELDAF